MAIFFVVALVGKRFRFCPASAEFKYRPFIQPVSHAPLDGRAEAAARAAVKKKRAAVPISASKQAQDSFTKKAHGESRVSPPAALPREVVESDAEGAFMTALELPPDRPSSSDALDTSVVRRAPSSWSAVEKASNGLAKLDQSTKMGCRRLC